MYRYYKRIAGLGSGNYIYYRKSKGLPDERINSIKTPGYGITLKLNYCGTKTRVEFNGSCLKQDKITYVCGKILKIYFVCKLTSSSSNNNDGTVISSLFVAVRLTKKLILISTDILVMELDLIDKEVFHFQVGHLAAT